MKQEMLINVAQPEECRIAIVEDSVLEELYVERTAQDNYVGNIYKGVVINLEPSIQAAFIDFGVGRNGFLHVSDVEPQYFRQGGFDPAPPPEGNGNGQTNAQRGRRRRTAVRPRVKPPIQDILRRGDEVLVQVTKEMPGRKGAQLTTYISLAGRYIVLTPGRNLNGVSRKIEDEQERLRLKAVMGRLRRPEEIGYIVRTVAGGQNKRELSKDLSRLIRMWKEIKGRVKKAEPLSLIHKEQDICLRTLRDYYTGDISEILVDERETLAKIKEYWAPKIVAELNNQYVKLVKFKGEFIWHFHEKEDELFYVVKGRFRMDFRDRKVWVKEGEMLVVPHGVEHKSVAEEEVHVIVFEPVSTSSTGNVSDADIAQTMERI